MNTLGKITLLLVDDHALVRDGIRSSLFHHPAISIVGEAVNGKDAERKCRELRPDVVLMDVEMPEMGGWEAITLIRKSSPGTKIILLTAFDHEEQAARVMSSGAQGYVSKNTSRDELGRAVVSVARGDAFFSPQISRALLENYVKGGKRRGKGEASDREIDVLRMVAQGKTTREIATQLKLSARTVETYRVRLKRKLKARNVVELLIRARERGLI